MDRSLARKLGAAAFLMFVLSIPVANWMIGHVGLVCVPQEACLIPVAPGVMAPSGVLTAGAALVLRDIVQRCLGARYGLFAILVGALLSALVVPASLVIASTTAFVLSEFVDFAIFSPLQRRGLIAAALASSSLGIVIDSTVFLTLAFHSLAFLPGQVIGKLWSIFFAMPLIILTRRLAPTPA